MRSVNKLGVRGLVFALIAVACAHCGSVKGAANGGGKTDAGDPTDVGDGSTADGDTDPDGGGKADTGIGDATVGDATVVGSGNDHCADATLIPLSGVNPRVDLVASTVGATHDVDAPCSSAQGPDTFYQFAVSKRVIVYADTFGASWNTVLFLLSSSCTPITTTMTGGAACNDDGCGSQQSQIVALLEPGSYRLGLSGQGGAQGTATIHFEWALAGSGTVTQLPATDSVQTGETSGSGNIDGISSSCVAAGPENSYWWARCPSAPAQTLHASTCGAGNTWESVVETQIPKAAPGLASAYRCNVDGCGLQATLGVVLPAGPGLGVLSIDGQAGNDQGAYSMAVTYTP